MTATGIYDKQGRERLRVKRCPNVDRSVLVVRDGRLFCPECKPAANQTAEVAR